MSEEYRTVDVNCECEHIEHVIRFQFWHDHEPDGVVYVSSPMRIQNIWRRFREAFTLIVWGEIDSGLDVLLDKAEVRKLARFLGSTHIDMIDLGRKFKLKQAKEAENERLERGSE